MPIDVFSEVVMCLSDMLQPAGAESGRAAVDREMRRLLG